MNVDTSPLPLVRSLSYMFRVRVHISHHPTQYAESRHNPIRIQQPEGTAELKFFLLKNPCPHNYDSHDTILAYHALCTMHHDIWFQAFSRWILERLGLIYFSFLQIPSIYGLLFLFFFIYFNTYDGRLRRPSKLGSRSGMYCFFFFFRNGGLI